MEFEGQYDKKLQELVEPGGMTEPEDSWNHKSTKDDEVCCAPLSNWSVKKPTCSTQQEQQLQHPGSSPNNEQAFLLCLKENDSESKKIISAHVCETGVEDDGGEFGVFSETHVINETRNVSVGAPITATTEVSSSVSGEPLHGEVENEDSTQQSLLHSVGSSSQERYASTPCENAVGIRRPEEIPSVVNNGHHTGHMSVSGPSFMHASPAGVMDNSPHTPDSSLRGALLPSSSLSTGTTGCWVEDEKGFGSAVSCSFNGSSRTGYVSNRMGNITPNKGIECSSEIHGAVPHTEDMVGFTSASLFQNVQRSTHMRDDTLNAGGVFRDNENKEQDKKSDVNDNDDALDGIHVTAPESEIERVSAQEAPPFISAIGEGSAGEFTSASRRVEIILDPSNDERAFAAHEDSFNSFPVTVSHDKEAILPAECIESSARMLQEFTRHTAQLLPNKGGNVSQVSELSPMASLSDTVACPDAAQDSPSSWAALQREGTDRLAPFPLSDHSATVTANSGDGVDSAHGKGDDASGWKPNADAKSCVAPSSIEIATAVVHGKDNDGDEFGDFTDAPLVDSAVAVQTQGNIEISKGGANLQEQTIEVDHQLNAFSIQEPFVVQSVRLGDDSPSSIQYPTVHEKEEKSGDSIPGQNRNNNSSDNNYDDDDDNDEYWADFADASLPTPLVSVGPQEKIKAISSGAVIPDESISGPSSQNVCDKSVPMQEVASSVLVEDADATAFVFERDIDVEAIKDLLLVVRSTLSMADSSGNTCNDCKEECVGQNSNKMLTKQLPDSSSVPLLQCTEFPSTEDNLASVMDALAFKRTKVTRGLNKGASIVDEGASVGASFILGDSVSMDLASYSFSLSLRMSQESYVSVDPIAAMQIAARHSTHQCEKLDAVLRQASEQQRHGPPVTVADLIARMRARVPQQGEQQNLGEVTVEDEGEGTVWRICPTLPIPSIGGGSCPEPSLRLPR